MDQKAQELDQIDLSAPTEGIEVREFGGRWEHPTGKSPKRIAILGLGPTAQDWHQIHVQYTPPIAAVDEVWTVNKGFRTVRCDLLFVMDDLIDEARRSPRYGQELAQYPGPIVTSTVDGPVEEGWPNALRYPLDEVLTFWGTVLHGRRTGTNEVEYEQAFKAGLEEAAYFSNSIPYLLAYAGMIGVENIAMFGCDYTFPGMPGREDDRANAEAWVYALQFGLGVSFQFPQRTTLMNRNKGRTFYGFNGRQPY